MARPFPPVTLNPDAARFSHAHREAGLLIDSHAHLDSPRYADDREAMLIRAWEAGVGAVLSIGIGEGPSEVNRIVLARSLLGEAARSGR